MIPMYTEPSVSWEPGFCLIRKSRNGSREPVGFHLEFCLLLLTLETTSSRYESDFICRRVWYI